MATILRNEDVARRWKGSPEDVVALADEASSAVSRLQDASASVVSSVTAANIETELETLASFREAFEKEAFPLDQIQKIVITVGDFNRLSPLSVQVELSRPAKRQVEESMAVVVRARGVEPVMVDGLVEALARKIAVGKRKVQFRTQLITWPVLVAYVIGQYFYIAHGPVIDLEPFLLYMYVIFVTILPTLVMIGAVKIFDWLIPPLELLKAGSATKWSRYKGRVLALAGTLAGMFVSAIVGVLVKS